MTAVRAAATAPEQKPDLRAHRESIELELPELVSILREWLGVRLVAYLGNVKSTRPVAEWATGERSPGAVDESRLRLAYHAAALMRQRYLPPTVQAWFKGGNPALGYEAPARVIRTGDPGEVTSDVLAAASAFAFIG